MQNPLKIIQKYTLLHTVNQYLYNKIHPTPPMTFFSVNDGVQACNQWAEQLPNDFDVIIGVPRAGLMFANIIACKFGRPLSTPDNFLRGELWFSHDAPMPSEVKKVLVVEDSVGFGKQITSVTAKLKAAYPNLQIETAGLFVIPQSKDLVDYSYAVKEEPNLFEWNILTATWSWGDVVSTLDGVLCSKPNVDWQQSPDKLIAQIKAAKPLLIPTYPLKAIVTDRPESTRDLTEQWLEKNNVKYENLIMLPDSIQPTAENVISIKCDVAKHIKPFWFWEQNIDHAIEIHRRARIPVLSTDEMRLIV
jgi:hypoxanthine phosphoribosyltransferase